MKQTGHLSFRQLYYISGIENILSMASGGSMASIHEDTTTLAETAIVVPAVKKMEGEVEISITTDDGTITSGSVA